MNEFTFKDLEGKVIEHVKVTETDVSIYTKEGFKFLLYHPQNCCESVTVDEVIGNIELLTGQEVIEAREECGKLLPSKDEYDESYTWTFYIIRTNRESVTIRFYGTSNGYYSERVDCEITAEKYTGDVK